MWYELGLQKQRKLTVNTSVAKYELSSRFVWASLVCKNLRGAFLARVYFYHASNMKHVAIDSVTFWRWHIAFGCIHCLDFTHRPVFELQMRARRFGKGSVTVLKWKGGTSQGSPTDTAILNLWDPKPPRDGDRSCPLNVKTLIWRRLKSNKTGNVRTT